MIDKIRKKSAVWAKHGKHRSVLMEVRKMAQTIRPKAEWSPSLSELWKRAKARRK